MSKRIKVLVDANSLVSKKSGIGHFTYRLIEGLAANPQDLDITAYYFNFLGRKTPPDLPGKGVVTYKVIRFWPTKLLNILHRFRLQLPLEFFLGLARYDFLVFPNFIAVPTLRRTPFMPVIHDLGFIDCPQYVSNGNRLYLQRFVRRTVRKAAFVGTISEFTKQRIHEVYGTSPEQTLVLPIPYEPSHPDETISGAITEIASRPFVLYVGTIEPRKNIDGLIKAFDQTSTQTRKHQLVLAGGWGWKTEAIQAAIATHKDDVDIVLPGYISNAEKEYLYQRASIVCIPSHYEGFGMQILEALYYKKKLLLSDIPVFHEVAGRAARYTDTKDIPSFAKDIEAVIGQAAPKKFPLPTWSWSENTTNLITRIKRATRP